MARDGTPGAALVRQDQNPADELSIPAKTLAGDLPGQAGLDVEWPERALERPKLGLDFLHRQRSCLRVPAEHIDRSPVTEVGEGNLHLG